VKLAPQGDQREPSRVAHDEGQGKRGAPGDAALKDPPGYGERDERKVDMGTGEALPGISAGRISSDPAKSVGTGRASEGSTVPRSPSGTT
jgi:hypothetical protein